MPLTLKSLPLAKQHSMAVIIIALLSLLAYFFNNTISDIFVYQHNLIQQGEWWRLFTGNFFHTNSYHFLLNIAALIILWALHGQFYTLKNYVLLFTLSALTCSLGLFYFSPDTQQYVGLSGILHGIYVFGAIMDIRAKEKTGYLLLAGLIIKVAHEQYYGASESMSTLINAHVVIDAHLWGAIGGLLFSCIYLFIHHKKIH